ncbi:hypothetical protein QJS04_geneDACA007143 [Acorus gramineus]|uniref:Uncharacterized protein n=1 Tax=Acorus gramineus TaxID=55184 RepID=A0AAV9BQX8_ACOGR|nr:hypothetical protein QJS04_geneDACA007143 [Acorus gramineus]
MGAGRVAVVVDIGEPWKEMERRRLIVFDEVKQRDSLDRTQERDNRPWNHHRGGYQHEHAPEDGQVDLERKESGDPRSFECEGQQHPEDLWDVVGAVGVDADVAEVASQSLFSTYLGFFGKGCLPSKKIYSWLADS